jgi:hypothetical protein
MSACIPNSLPSSPAEEGPAGAQAEKEAHTLRAQLECACARMDMRVLRRQRTGADGGDTSCGQSGRGDAAGASSSSSESGESNGYAHHLSGCSTIFRGSTANTRSALHDESAAATRDVPGFVSMKEAGHGGAASCEAQVSHLSEMLECVEVESAEHKAKEVLRDGQKAVDQVGCQEACKEEQADGDTEMHRLRGVAADCERRCTVLDRELEMCRDQAERTVRAHTACAPSHAPHAKHAYTCIRKRMCVRMNAHTSMHTHTHG